MAKKKSVKKKPAARQGPRPTKSPGSNGAKKLKRKKGRLASEVFASKSRFYKGTDIDGEFTATITRRSTEIFQKKGKDVEKTVIWLQGLDKGIVLNQTMGLQLGDDLGDEIDSWSGQRITVFTERAPNPTTGKTGPAVRVRGAIDEDVAEEEDTYEEEVDEIEEEEEEFDDDEID